MKLTRRGYAVVAVVAGCLVMAWLYGARSLNALVAPLLLALLAAVVAVSRAEAPTVERAAVEDGFVGERRTVSLSLTAGNPIAATVEDEVGDGLATIREAPSESWREGIVADPEADAVADLTIAEGSEVTYDVRLTARGERTVGPVTVTVRDVLGLVSREFSVAATGRVLVYPEVYDLRGASRRDLRTLALAIREGSREEFDHLREYDRGDSLRDVHWKSTAKRADGELVVKEFVADDDVGEVALLAEAGRDRADQMATATASVATYLLESGVRVSVATPAGSLPSRAGHDHHLEALRLLARTGDGIATDRARREADVVVRADETGTVVAVGEETIPFDRFREGDLRTGIAPDSKDEGREVVA
ncbi:DUF58 domain-containing protein [Saliphagus sp. LR7]|uniref:DUF58 domain-containing protein n=1 Tax=Saliphagus sp. LR7 TaxID=2282654 RepID=UPI000DF81F89|nr:DUF58 domain-containing protein [Saliphagus sp. LR7]